VPPTTSVVLRHLAVEMQIDGFLVRSTTSQARILSVEHL